MASKVTVTLVGGGSSEVITGATAVTVEASPARLVVNYTEGGVSKVKVFNWSSVVAYLVEPDA